MATFTYPGVYIQEIPSAAHTITGVATSIAAFAGWAARGPTGAANLVLSWPDFERSFGGLDPNSNLGYAVQQFFLNGGQQAYIIRLTTTGLTGVAGGTPVAATATITMTGGSLAFTAHAKGAWANSYGLLVAKSSDKVAAHFRLSLVYAPLGAIAATVESWDNLDDTGLGTIISNYGIFSVTSAPTGVPALGLTSLTSGADGTNAAQAAATISGLTFDSTTTTGPSVVTIETGGAGGLTLTAANAGAWGNGLSAQIQPGADDYTRFTLSVLLVDPVSFARSVVESFSNLSLDPRDASGRYVVQVLNEQSNYMTASMDAATPLVITNTPSVPAGPLAAGSASICLIEGVDGSVLTPTMTAGSPGNFETALLANGAGVNLLDSVPLFNILVVPGEIDPATISTLQAYAVGKRAFLIVDCEQDASFRSLQTGPDPGMTGQNGINAAFYFPWVNAYDPVQDVTRPFPPSGMVAGLYAATDASRGVWKAPAGISAGLTGEAGLTNTLTDIQNGVLNVQAINCIRHFPAYGDVVWGSRTMRGNDEAGSDWKYVPVRRFALFLESSLHRGSQWVVFEPNDETLWGQVRLNVGAFMQGLFLQGAFAGSTPRQAYFVKCDAENNPPASIAQGIVNILVGFAPLYPAEFVVIQIEQIAAQSQPKDGIPWHSFRETRSALIPTRTSNSASSGTESMWPASARSLH
ncbi:phage tail sheath subtilisin-like domain-containing protein [Granulicella sibirica]|uniref:Phage tail sheath protein FI n=1 Tax=Granulicella sibirica TaxID=2479048 RepID=A0A4Q0T6Y7_9BACT|nr:phage tail sheath subtilisin-like domain-containing protein [Granulicella sibirica]RXH57878.1 Phage tail sheath protein FI [Granulicella sibirica]